jgi:hypothetical protein
LASLHSRFHQLLPHLPCREAHALPRFAERTPLKPGSRENRGNGSSSKQTRK